MRSNKNLWGSAEGVWWLAKWITSDFKDLSSKAFLGLILELLFVSKEQHLGKDEFGSVLRNGRGRHVPSFTVLWLQPFTKHAMKQKRNTHSGHSSMQTKNEVPKSFIPIKQVPKTMKQKTTKSNDFGARRHAKSAAQSLAEQHRLKAEATTVGFSTASCDRMHPKTHRFENQAVHSRFSTGCWKWLKTWQISWAWPVQSNALVKLDLWFQEPLTL